MAARGVLVCSRRDGIKSPTLLESRSGSTGSWPSRPSLRSYRIPVQEWAFTAGPHRINWPLVDVEMVGRLWEDENVVTVLPLLNASNQNSNRCIVDHDGALHRPCLKAARQPRRVTACSPPIRNKPVSPPRCFQRVRLFPQAAGSRTSNHWGFRVDLPANNLGP
jgi:hypothetical protein